MKNSKNKSKVFCSFLLVAVFVLAVFLRVLYLKDNSLTFGYDQARDALITRQILDRDIKIQGPPSSQPGLFHGVFYYYFLVPAYLLGKGSPVFVAYYVSIFNSLAVFWIYLLAKNATKNIKLALLSSILFAVSFESSQYATWLSNPTIAVCTIPLMYLGLWLWTHQSGSKTVNFLAPVITAISLGLSVQAEIFLIYHVIPVVIWLIFYKKSISKKSLLYFFITFILAVFTLILCELKFGLNSINAFSTLAVSTEANLAYAKSVGDFAILYLNQIGRVFAFNTYPGNIGYGGILIIVLGIISLFRFKKEPYPAFLAIWLFSHLSVVTVGGTSTPFLMVGIGPAVSLILGYYIFKLMKNKFILGILAVFIVVYGNLNFIFKENPFGSTLFSIQRDMLLSKQMSAIDYTYKTANGQDFSINSVTSPLWINIVWSYLYKWYGMPKYGYVPKWHGKDQVGQLDSLERVTKPYDISFLVVEPMAGIPVRYKIETIGEEDTKSFVVEEKYFGEIIMQYRKLLYE